VFSDSAKNDDRIKEHDRITSSGYGPSGAVGALEDLVGRSRVRTPILLPNVKKRRVMNFVLCVLR
jgi:hypothetical protein